MESRNRARDVAGIVIGGLLGAVLYQACAGDEPPATFQRRELPAENRTVYPSTADAGVDAPPDAP